MQPLKNTTVVSPSPAKPTEIQKFDDLNQPSTKKDAK